MTNDIHSEFEILRTLGVGGMASVYLARVNGRDVAVKKLHSFLAADPMSVATAQDRTRARGSTSSVCSTSSRAPARPIRRRS